MDYAASFLNTLRPLFPETPAPNGIFWAEFISEIGRLSFGDDPKIVRPEPRLPGQPARPVQMSFCRLRALEWAAFLKARGAEPKSFQRAIELAFGADWDAIRHWPKSISKVIGQQRMERDLAFAIDGYFVDRRHWHTTLMDPLRIDGEWYRSEIGLPAMSEEVIHTSWENLTRSLSVHVQLRLR